MEHVILVDDNDAELGTLDKMKAHEKALLHRAFSVFIFNAEGEMLLQKRAEGKYHSGGLWTNSCCSHPRPGEDTAIAAARRLKEEMGFDTPIKKVFDFIYTASFENGLSEYEYDHVFIGYYNGSIDPDPKEVSDYAYLSLEQIATALHSDPASFTAWFHIAFPRVNTWLQQNKP